jgi:16S rRNA (guanine1207-N2)-methyltransferase
VLRLFCKEATSAMGNAVDTLLRASDGLSDTVPDGRIVFFNANLPEQGLEPDLAKRLDCQQSFRPTFLRLQAAGLSVSAHHERQGDHVAAFVLLGKQRDFNRDLFAKAFAALSPGCFVIIGGDKTLGIAAIKRELANHVALENSVAKNHATALVYRVPPQPITLSAPGQMNPILDSFSTVPGIFSPSAIDPGSQLLADQFDGRINGVVADFGAGWGYLSAMLLERSKPTTLDVIEAEALALDMARHNVRSNDVSISFHWLDLTREAVPQSCDWIVMNPPFHDGRSADPALGIAMIKAARKALKPRGKLLLVANRQLPYEVALASLFSRSSTIAEAHGFKCIEASL